MLQPVTLLSDSLGCEVEQGCSVLCQHVVNSTTKIFEASLESSMLEVKRVTKCMAIEQAVSESLLLLLEQML